MFHPRSQAKDGKGAMGIGPIRGGLGIEAACLVEFDTRYVQGCPLLLSKLISHDECYNLIYEAKPGGQASLVIIL